MFTMTARSGELANTTANHLHFWEKEMSDNALLSLCYQWVSGHTIEQTPNTRKGRMGHSPKAVARRPCLANSA